MTFGTFGIDLNLHRIPSQMERNVSQQSHGDHKHDDPMISHEALGTLSKPIGDGSKSTKHATPQLSPEQSAQMKEFTRQFKEKAQPLMNVLQMFGEFYRLVISGKLTSRSKVRTNQEQLTKLKEELNKLNGGQENEEKSKKVGEQMEKLKEENSKLVTQFSSNDFIINSIKSFLMGEKIRDMVIQIGKFIQIMQASDPAFQESSLLMISTVFHCFIPEINEEVIIPLGDNHRELEQVRKEHAKMTAEQKEKEESLYVQMEPVKKKTETTEEPRLN
jgi:DNA uptake protein ComE-like DNA-binding protein